MIEINVKNDAENTFFAFMVGSLGQIQNTDKAKPRQWVRPSGARSIN